MDRDETTVSGPGLGFTPFETRPELILAVAREADRLGFARVSVAEAMGHAAPVLLAEIAQHTQRVELATTVLPVWSRSPAVLAMTAAGLQRLRHGRFVLGLGAGTPPLIEGLHGIGWQDPFGKLRAVLTAVRALLEGHRMPTAVDGSRPLRLFVDPETRVPIALASMSPPGIRLAGELADRWLPFLWPRSQLDAGRRLVEEGALACGREQLPEVCPAIPLATGRDRAAAEAVAARWLTVYCMQMGPIYPGCCGNGSATRPRSTRCWPPTPIVTNRCCPPRPDAWRRTCCWWRPTTSWAMPPRHGGRQVRIGSTWSYRSGSTRPSCSLR